MPPLQGISIRLRRGGSQIETIRFIYVNHKTKDWGDETGEGLKAPSLQLREGEYIESIAVNQDPGGAQPNLYGIQFTTNTGITSEWYGGKRGKENKVFRANPGAPVPAHPSSALALSL